MKSAAAANIIVALAYCLGGYTGNMLAIPPAYVSPIWPAAGVALAALLLRGRQILPGLIAGVLAAQLYAFLNDASSEQILISAMVAAGTGAGSVLQALAGMWLIHRYVGFNDPLIEDRKIGNFLFLGGPLSCVIAPSIGTTTLFLADMVDDRGFLLTWSSWWVGDVLGVLVVTPMLLILLAEPRSVWSWRIRSVLLPMLVLLIGVMILFRIGYQLEWLRMSSEFGRQVNALHITLVDDTREHIDRNRALKALFDSSTDVTEEDFEHFAGSLLDETAGVYAMEWIPRVPHAQRPDFEKGWRDIISIHEPGSGNRMAAAATREEYFPIRYLVPYKGNERALGFDIGTNPVALATARRARDTGGIAATPPIDLVQDPGERKGTVLYSPVYSTVQPPGSVKDRRRELKGFVATVFRVSDSINEILSEKSGLQLNLVIHSQGEHLYSSLPEDQHHDRAQESRLRSVEHLEVADKVWELSYTPSDGFYQNQLFWNLWWLLLSGFLFTAFTGGGLMVLTGHTLRTETLVRKRTRELEDEGRQRQRIINIMEMQNEVLQAIVGPGSLKGVLNLIANLTEMFNPDMICSILLLDQEGKCLRVGAAPSLPEFYNEAIDGLVIGEGVGTCGTAAWKGELVIAEDVMSHPDWEEYRELAEKADLRACWSEPIVSGENILGVFSLYYRSPKSPDEEEVRLIRDLARIASIAIEQKLSESRIQRLAFYDTLTDLPNRRLLLDRLEREIAVTRRHDSCGAILFIDLDNFKTLNDSLGHQVGDELLIQAARRLTLCIREEDTAARHGGDEFVILMRADEPDVDRLSEYVHNMARRIQEDLGEPYDLDGYTHHISVSIGITFFSRDSDSPDEILKQADTAMYSAKSLGRNAISFYHPDMQRHVNNRLQLEKNLRTALEEEQFTLLYQPQYDINFRIVAAEALIRWQHPERGLVSPQEFIPLAEENKLIIPIGEWVMQRASEQLHEWPELEYIAINISPVQLREEEFVERARRVLRPHEKQVRRLMLEMTEGIMIENIEETMEVIRKLQNLGIGISIDDFGRGYSSLVYLKSLPLNQLKIDKGFVHDIESDPNGRVIVETIIAMGRHLQLDVIAEGVETDYQLAYLRGQGCHKYQGFYFNPPLNADQFGKLLTENLGRKTDDN